MVNICVGKFILEKQKDLSKVNMGGGKATVEEEKKGITRHM